MSAVVDLLAALEPALRRYGHRWFLFGAQAVVVWGRPRMSADVDITVEADPDDASAIARLLGEAGFSSRTLDVVGFASRTRVIPLLHSASGLPLDVVLAGPGLEEEFLSRAVLVKLGGVVVPVISPEDLIVAKILAGRPKDIDDVRGIVLERRSSLDIARVFDLLGLLEGALSRRDLVSVFEAQLSIE